VSRERWEDRTRRLAEQRAAAAVPMPCVATGAAGCQHHELIEALEQQLAAARQDNRVLAAKLVGAEREASVARTLAEDIVIVFGGALDQRRRTELVDAIAPTAGRFRSAVLQAIKRGKEWELREDEYDRLVELLCYYCGGEVGAGVGLDRVDNRLGYTWTNVVPCCGPCNISKGTRRAVL
jgi:hypothetical protein